MAAAAAITHREAAAEVAEGEVVVCGRAIDALPATHQRLHLGAVQGVRKSLQRMVLVILGLPELLLLVAGVRVHLLLRSHPLRLLIRRQPGHLLRPSVLRRRRLLLAVPGPVLLLELLLLQRRRIPLLHLQLLQLLNILLLLHGLDVLQLLHLLGLLRRAHELDLLHELGLLHLLELLKLREARSDVYTRGRRGGCVFALLGRLLHGHQVVPLATDLLAALLHAHCVPRRVHRAVHVHDCGHLSVPVDTLANLKFPRNALGIGLVFLQCLPLGGVAAVPAILRNGLLAIAAAARSA
mmetsp:Transcript_8938/g.25663  ORF Transcript_8938/g.25663 Transcript_8938/m.25663 type:complete len:296 (+) Transcript_8938:1274-2161(+)